jgi:4-amino-4-deoxy-L-arabinose transferase-like glycosyltransferase
VKPVSELVCLGGNLYLLPGEGFFCYTPWADSREDSVMKFELRKSNTLLLCILAAGLIVRIAAVTVFHPPLFSDDIDYVALGQSIAHGQGYQLEGHPTAYRPPGYPLLLALSFSLFGYSLAPVRLAQTFADLLSCLLLYALGRKLFSERVALIGAAIFALFPTQILYVSMLMTETVCTTLLLLYLFLCAGEARTVRRSFLAGIVLGAGILVRPTMLLLPAVVLAIRWWKGWTQGENLRALALTAAGALLCVLPWLMRNYEQFGQITLTSNTGVNFWIGTHSGASGAYSFPPDNPLVPVRDELERSNTGVRLGLQFIRAHPLEYGVILVKKWAHFFSVDYWMLLSVHYRPDLLSAPRPGLVYSRLPLLSVLAVHAPFAVVLLLGTFGFFCHAAGDRNNVFFLVAPCAYWILVHMAFFAEGRLRFPVVPLLMIGAAYGADILARRAVVWTRKRAAAFCLMALLFVAGWAAERIIIQSQVNAYGDATSRVKNTGNVDLSVTRLRRPPSNQLHPLQSAFRAPEIPSSLMPRMPVS